MQTPTSATTATQPEQQQPAPADSYSDALAILRGCASGPDDRSGGIDHLVEAAHQAREAYDELDWSHVAANRDDADAEVIEILRRARELAYDAWQTIERSGLPLLQRWQRETCGYSEDEVTR